MVLAGVVDPGFRGELKVWLFNPRCQPFIITAGNAIAQLVPTRYASDISVVVDGKRNQEPKPRTHHDGGMGYTP
jgi:dUTPase